MPRHRGQRQRPCVPQQYSIPPESLIKKTDLILLYQQTTHLHEENQDKKGRQQYTWP